MARNRRTTLLIPLLVILLAPLLLFHRPAKAEDLTLVRTAHLAADNPGEPLRRPIFRLDDQGSVMVRVGDVRITLNYEIPNPAADSGDLAGRSPQRDRVACQGCFTVKLGLTF